MIIFFLLFILLTVSGISFISLFYMVAMRQLVIHERLKKILPLPFVNPWKILAAYRNLLRDQQKPLGAWRLMHVLLLLTLLLLLAPVALLTLP